MRQELYLVTKYEKSPTGCWAFFAYLNRDLMFSIKKVTLKLYFKIFNSNNFIHKVRKLYLNQAIKYLIFSRYSTGKVKICVLHYFK